MTVGLVAILVLAGAGIAASAALANVIDRTLTAWAWRRRARRLPRRGNDGGARRRSTADPILRARAGARDAALAARLPGGAIIAARLAASGTSLSLTRLVGLAGSGALLIAATALWLGAPPLLGLVLLPGLAIVIVFLVSGMLARRARAAFARGFPEAVAVMIRSLRAGLPVPGAIAEAARATTGPVAAAFGSTVEAMQLGQPLEAALWAAARTARIPDFDFFVTTVALQRETGGNLAETLTNLDDTLRSRRQLALKLKALAAEARASAMIIGSLPFAMGGLMAAVSPEYTVTLFTTGLGRAMLGAGLGSIAIGAVVISQMMKIEA